jgi:hypothetical protein
MTIFAAKHRPAKGPFVASIIKNGTNDEFAYMSVAGLARPGATNYGYRFQAKGSSVEVAFTLDDPIKATNPASQGSVAWEVVSTVAPGTSVQVDSTSGTAFRFKFVDPGSITVSSL